MEEVNNQQQSVITPAETATTAITEPQTPAVVPAQPASEPSAPPQAETQKSKGRDAAARINQLTARVKITADELEQTREENRRLKSATNAGGSDGAAPVAQPDNPYAPIGTGLNGEVTQDDLEGLPPVMRQMYDRVQEMTKERENTKTTTALEQSIATNFEAYPEIAGVVDDAEIALEMSKRRIPLHNADLVFAGRALGVARTQIKSLETEIATLKGELHKDTVASPVTGSTKPAPPEQIERQYAPGERMAEARRKAATAKG